MRAALILTGKCSQYLLKCSTMRGRFLVLASFILVSKYILIKKIYL